MDLGLAGKSVLITGASGGIGSAVARRLASEGAQIAVHYHRNRSAADSLVQAIGNQRACAFGADLTDEAQVAATFAQVADRFGQVDALVANAGVWPEQDQPIHQMTLQQWDTTLATDLTSVFLSCREFLRNVKNNQVTEPAMVLIGSTAAVFGEAGHGDYAAAKSGLAYGLMLTLKNEIVRLSPAGRVNTVCPGWTMTPMAEKFTDDGRSIKRALSTIAMRKVAGPDDIACPVAFLLSPLAAGHISGQVLTVSGGMEGRQLFEDAELDVGKALPKH